MTMPLQRKSFVRTEGWLFKEGLLRREILRFTQNDGMRNKERDSSALPQNDSWGNKEEKKYFLKIFLTLLTRGEKCSIM